MWPTVGENVTNPDLGAEMAFDSVSREVSLRDQVSQAIRAALISGRLLPGVLYSAPALAEQLGVSATPVREAMLELVREGHIEVARNKGFRVREVHERELDQLAEIRLLLEVPTMGRIAEHHDERAMKELVALREVAQQLEEAAAAVDLLTFMQLDTEFHTRFLALHGNGEMVKLVRDLRARSRLYGLEQLARSGLLVESTREHATMIDLALAKKRAGLEGLMRQHIGHIRTIWADGTGGRSGRRTS